MKKYYVFVQNKIIIHDEWDKVKGLTSIYHENPISIDKLFESVEAAEVDSPKSIQSTSFASTDGNAPSLDADGIFSFVDGSYNSATGTYGYGGFLSVNGEKHYIYGSDHDEEMASMHNVAGEISGSMAAIAKAIDLGLDHITIYYDYKGIERWCQDGYVIDKKGNRVFEKKWKTTKAGTARYVDFYNKASEKIKISFSKVAAHTGIEGNEIVDRLAKYAVNADLSKKDKDMIKELLPAASFN